MSDLDSHINITRPDFVNEKTKKVAKIEGNAEAMLDLIDLIYGFTQDKLPPS